MVIRRKISDFRYCFRSVALFAATLSPPSVRKELVRRIKRHVGICLQFVYPWARVLMCMPPVLVAYSHCVKVIELLGASTQRLRQQLQQRLCTLPYPCFSPSKKKPQRGFHDRLLAYVFVSNSVSVFFHVCCPVFARVKKPLTLSRMFFVEDEKIWYSESFLLWLDVMLRQSSTWSSIVGDLPFRNAD